MIDCSARRMQSIHRAQQGARASFIAGVSATSALASRVPVSPIFSSSLSDYRQRVEKAVARS
jgi:hypothetical protein